MKVAAFHNGCVFVTDNQQTVIVTTGVSIRLDWSRWVTETLGVMANNATYSFSRTQLSESGSTIGTTEELVISQDTERVTVNISKETNEFYIEITNVLVNQSDSDRAIFDLEACHSPLNGNEVCFNSNITIYAVQRPEPLRKLYCTSVIIGHI